MRLQRIVITKLFGLYDHDIPLRLEERVTILHGPNGVGKTVVLKLVHGLLSGDIKSLARIPFESFRVEFEGGAWAEFKPSDQGTGGSLQWSATGETKHSRIRDQLPDAWPARSPHTLLLIPIERLSTQVSIDDVFRASLAGQPIPATQTIQRHSQHLAKLLDESARQYGAIAQDRDRSFPTRMLQPRATPLPSNADLQARFEAIEERQRQLQALGLLDHRPLDPVDIEQIDDTRRAVMAILVDDMNAKLAVFDHLQPRVQLLADTIGRRFKNKRMEIGAGFGYRFIAPDGRTIPLEVLSSGEQHELVMLYGLIFEAQPGSLVLIDEPELSLHLAWQKEFTSDLIQIAQLNGFDAIVATHSPYIIAEHRDLMVGLRTVVEERTAA